MLEFADGRLLTIHRSILLRCARLSTLLDSSTTSIDLRKHSSVAGHALVGYLYSNRYDLPKWTGPVRRGVNEHKLVLRANFEAYALARALELDDLGDQIKPAIELEAWGLDIFTIVDVVKKAYPAIIGNDTWFPHWIKSHMKKAFKDPGTLTTAIAQPDFKDDSSVFKVMFGCMLETYADMLESLRGHDSASELDTPVTDSSFSNISHGQLPSDDEASDGSYLSEQLPLSAPESVHSDAEPQSEAEPEPELVPEPGVEPEPGDEAPPAEDLPVVEGCAADQELLTDGPAPEPALEAVAAADEPVVREEEDSSGCGWWDTQAKISKKKVTVPHSLPSSTDDTEQDVR
jgi:hypothetical protein